MIEIKELIRIDKEIYDRAKKTVVVEIPCQQCGWCCNNKRILVTIPEMIRILKYTRFRFFKVFNIESNRMSVSIKTKKIDDKYYCIFYDNGKCTIHNIKPFQCFTYPIIFHPLVFEINPPLCIANYIYVFKCQTPKNSKAVSSITVKDFEEITSMRIDFLRKNYEIQRKLIIKKKLRKVIEDLI
ncbi:MAG: YkgJ family cysteine cluster protein [Candidatus Heimdallarchaeaceae archaeon]